MIAKIQMMAKIARQDPRTNKAKQSRYELVRIKLQRRATRLVYLVGAINMQLPSHSNVLEFGENSCLCSSFALPRNRIPFLYPLFLVYKEIICYSRHQ